MPDQGARLIDDRYAITPTLRLDIVAKLQQVNVAGNHRSIFDFGQAPQVDLGGTPPAAPPAAPPAP